MRLTLEKVLWGCTILIIGMGLIALYSATYDNVRVTQRIFYDQLVCAGLGFIVMYILSKIDYRRFYDVAYGFYALNVVLLILVLVMGRHALGATRWIQLGPISFQPSELSKLALILALGRYISDRKPVLSFGFFTKTQEFVRQFLFPLGMTGLLMLLIFKQPDLGTSLLLGGMFITMVFAGGIDYKIVFGFLGLCTVLSPFAWLILKPYQKDRLLVFLNPNIDPLGAGYTIIQSKIAIGSGQIFGKGWLSGTQNQLNFLPERHTDFIFSVIGEEWGLIGTMTLLFLYFILIMTSIQIAAQMKDRFGMIVTMGIVSIYTLQVVINIGMVIGMFPIVGLTLPLVSYGRSSFLVSVIMMGFLLNLSKKRTIF